MSRRRAARSLQYPQLVGRKQLAGDGLATPYSGASLTSLTDGLATAPATGDIIFIGYSLGDIADATMTIQDAGGSNYTLVGSELYSNDTRDINLRVAYKVAGGSPDTTFNFNDGFAGDSGATVIMVQVWRYFNVSSPLDVSAVTAVGTNTGQPNPGSITPATRGSVILSFSAGSAATGSTPTDLANSDHTAFWAASRSGTNYASAAGGHGYKLWTGGAFDPSAYTGGSSSTLDAWASVILALRPA